MNAVERPALSGNEYTDYVIMPWVEYADYLENLVLTLTEERDELENDIEWMRGNG
jgi:hypothetical protein